MKINQLKPFVKHVIREALQKKTSTGLSPSGLPTVKSLGLSFTPQEKKVMILAINSFTTGGHPQPTNDSIEYFTRDFVVSCLKKGEKLLTGKSKYVKDLNVIKTLLQKLTKSSVRKESMTTRTELDKGVMKAVNLESYEDQLRGKFVNRGEVQLEGGIDPKLANEIANHHWDIFGSYGKDERGVFNFKTRGDRWCCAVGLLKGQPAILSVTTTPGRLELLVGEDQIFPNKEELDEMTSTGAAAGYSTPFAFTKNKKGSPKGIAAAKKYGKVVGESPRV